MPTPRKGEKENDFVSRYVASAEAKKSFPNVMQRVAVAHSVWKKYHKKHVLEEAEKLIG